MASKQNRAGSIPASLASAAVVGVAATAAGAGLMSWLIIREVLSELSIGYSAMGILLIASFLSAWVALSRAQKKAMVVSALSGLIYYGILLLVNMLCYKGGMEGTLVTGLLVLGGTGAALLLFLKRSEEGGRRRRKNKRW